MGVGRVSLVGTGPGAPELLTLLGQRRLAEADVVLYDRLLNPALLQFSRPEAQRLNVGKLPRHHRIKQTEITALLIKLAQAGKKVVRLKAGDPYVFGRGGEESQALAAAGIDFEVVPGITSALAGLAAVGIPMTHRDYAASFQVITGQRRGHGAPIDWAHIAPSQGTLVFLMGMTQLPQIVARLQQYGQPAHTPVAVIQWATHWRQRVVTGDLTTIVSKVKQAGLGAPSLIVVGDVVRLQATLAPKQPLQGCHLLVPHSQRQHLYQHLTDQGAAVQTFWRSQPQPVAFQWPTLTPGQPLVITDVTAWHYLQQALLAQGQDLRSFDGHPLWTEYQMTARQLREQGLLVAGQGFPDQAVVIGAQEDLPRLTLTATQVAIATYRRQALDQTALPIRDFHGAVFTSQRAFLDLWQGLNRTQQQQLRHLPCFSFGVQISQLAQQYGCQRCYTVAPQQATAQITAWWHQTR
jgi:uroporphyrinogen III methyltransferase/synthase